MKIGVGAALDQLPLLERLGYDYVEANFGWLASLDEAEFCRYSQEVERSSLAVEAYNCFFKGDMVLYAPNGDQDSLLREIRAYAERGLARASAWGGKVAVIGSGNARKMQEWMTCEEADRQFARVLNVCGEVADRYGMKIAVEPLSLRECNYIHTVAEGAAVAKQSGSPAVGVMVDFFHHHSNGDDLAALPNYADILYHAHYARPNDRLAPMMGDEPALAAVAALLRQCPKAERISLECRWGTEFETAVTTARPLMDIFKGNDQ